MQGKGMCYVQSSAGLGSQDIIFCSFSSVVGKDKIFVIPDFSDTTADQQLTSQRHVLACCTLVVHAIQLQASTQSQVGNPWRLASMQCFSPSEDHEAWHCEILGRAMVQKVNKKMMMCQKTDRLATPAC